MNPKTLIDLIKLREPRSSKKSIKERITNGEISLGRVWENVLTSRMSHTSFLGRNSKGQDWDDGSDGKFAMAMFDINTGAYYASIGGVKNKTGVLRCCICDRLDDYKLYFMLIPYKAYSKWTSGSPLKIRFSNGKPEGIVWEKHKKYECTFEEVCSDVG